MRRSMAFYFVAAVLLAFPSGSRGQEIAEEESPTMSAAERGHFGFRMTYEPGTGEGGAIRVVEITGGSSLQPGDLKPGDLIVAIDGEVVDFDHNLDMIRSLGRFRPGQLVRLAVLRDDEPSTLEVELGRRSPEQKLALERWLESAARFYEQPGCGEGEVVPAREEEEAARRMQAFAALRARIPDGGLEISVERRAAGELQVSAGDVTLPADFNVATVVPPPIAESIDRLGPGESLRLWFREEHGELRLKLVDEGSR